MKTLCSLMLCSRREFWITALISANNLVLLSLMAPWNTSYRQVILYTKHKSEIRTFERVVVHFRFPFININIYFYAILVCTNGHFEHKKFL